MTYFPGTQSKSLSQLHYISLTHFIYIYMLCAPTRARNYSTESNNTKYFIHFKVYFASSFS